MQKQKNSPHTLTVLPSTPTLKKHMMSRLNVQCQFACSTTSIQTPRHEKEVIINSSTAKLITPEQKTVS